MDQAERKSRQDYFQKILKDIQNGEQLAIWFTVEFIDKLKIDHRLSVSNEVLMHDLQEMTFLYLDEGPYGVRDPKGEESKTETLSELVTQIGILNVTILAEGREPWSGVLQEINKAHVQMPDSDTTIFPSKVGLDSDLAAFSFTQRYLAALQKHFKKQIPKESPKKRGHPREKGVEYFVWYGLQAWEDYLGKPYTIDVHKGEPTSPALSFISDILERIDPDAPKTSIVTAARKARKHPRPF